MSAPEIHGYVGCPFAWRVRLAAAEKGVEAAWIPCDVDDPDPRAAAHNPEEHSPLLWHQGFVLRESEIIMMYLDEAFEGRTLVPTSPRERARLRLTSVRLAALDVHTEPSRPAARKKSEPALRLLAESLAGRSFLHGDEPGLYDLVWWPMLANIVVRGLLDERAHSDVAAYARRLAARPASGTTAPPWAAGLG